MTGPEVTDGGDGLDFDDRGDFQNADRGFVAGPLEGTVLAEDGRVVWDFAATGLLAGDCPPTAHPSLWRQSQLCARGRACTRWPRASTRCAASTCRT